MPEQGAGGEVPRIRVYLKQDVSGVVRAESALYMEEKVDEPEPVAAEEGKKEGEGKKKRMSVYVTNCIFCSLLLLFL